METKSDLFMLSAIIIAAMNKALQITRDRDQCLEEKKKSIML